MNRFSKILTVVVMMAMASTLAFADAATCSSTIGNNPPIADNMTNSTGCMIGTHNNEKPITTHLNTDNVFGSNSWQEFGAAQGTISGLGENAGGKSGSLTLNVNWGNVGMLIIVLKGPNAPGTTPLQYVAYQIQHGYNGTISWTTPFSKNGVAQDVSHVEAYFVPGATQVPEPASLVLLGSGLVAMGGAARRKFFNK